MQKYLLGSLKPKYREKHKIWQPWEENGATGINNCLLVFHPGDAQLSNWSNSLKMLNHLTNLSFHPGDAESPLQNFKFVKFNSFRNVLLNLTNLNLFYISRYIYNVIHTYNIHCTQIKSIFFLYVFNDHLHK